MGFFVAGWLIHWFWIIGALRLAKPRSVWARHFYDGPKLARAKARHGQTPSHKPCPDCAEQVQAAARVCRFCGYRFEPEPEPAAATPATHASQVALASAAPPAMPPRAAAVTAARRSRNLLVPAVIVVALVGVALTAVFALTAGSDDSSASAPAVPPAPAARSATKPKPVARPGESQPIKQDFERRYGVGPHASKWLRLLISGPGGLYVQADSAPDPEVTVTAAGRTVSSYADAPTKANERMWPLNLSGENTLELVIRNDSTSVRVYKVGFFTVDAPCSSGAGTSFRGCPGAVTTPALPT